MNTNPPRRPVCRYDGHCYRKNDDHFREYTHPIQHPELEPTSAPSADTSATTGMTVPAAAAAEIGRTAPQHTAPPLTQHAPTVTATSTTVIIATPPTSPLQGATPADSPTPVDPSDVEEVEAQPVAAAAATAAHTCSTRNSRSLTPVDGNESEEDDLEGGMASLALLQHLLNPSCQPHLSQVGVAVPSDPPEGFTVADLYPDFIGIDTYLHHIYGNALVFCAADVRVVLRAAMQLNPQSPLTAFRGWRLAGPFEAAYRAYTHAHAHARHHSHAKSSTCYDPFLNECARWRCARYRYDPPECQTIAVEMSDAHEATARAALADEDGFALPPLHVGYHRDEPGQVPTMVVMSGVSRGTACAPKGAALPKEAYTWLPVSTYGAEFFLVWAREHKDSKTEAALEQAMREAATSEKSLNPLPSPESVSALSTLQKTARSRRKRCELASTIHGLGIVAPYDAKTELGYRPLVMTRPHLTQLLTGWDSHFRQWRTCLGENAEEAEGREEPCKVARVEGDPRRASVLLFTATPWTELQEQFRYADMANDEGDYGLNLELGIDLFALVHAASLPHPPSSHTLTAAEATMQAHNPGAAPITEEMKRGLHPLLWHSFRVLDCVYMLLTRDLYRHVLRCHVPMLAGVSPLLRGPPLEIATGPHLWASS